MIGRPNGLERQGLLLTIVILLVFGAWLAWPGTARDPVTERLPRVEFSPPLAEATLDRFESFRAGPSGGTLALGDAELTSVLRYAMPGILPAGESEADVRFAGSRVALSARVTIVAFPDLPVLDPVVGILPDTVHVRVEGTLAPFGSESLAFQVDRIEVIRIPLPSRLVPKVLAGLGRTHRRGLSANALHVPLPGGLASVYVERDSLILVGAP